jgi:hypothetical protein
MVGRKVIDELLQARLSFIPIGTNKRPLASLLPQGSWEPFMSRRPDESDPLNRWANAPAIAVIGGDVSGGLLVLDFDQIEFYDAWVQKVGGLAKGIPVQKTGGGGRQVFLRCESPGRNMKLARSLDGLIAIETRGEGGYALVPPSKHPSGNEYAWLVGDLLQIPTFSMQGVEDLLYVARSLDERPAPPRRISINDEPGSIHSVIDAFNRKYTIQAMLERYDYEPDGDRYTRPGSESGPGVIITDHNTCMSFHGSCPLNDGKDKDPFGVYTIMEHGGDHLAAVRAAALELNMTLKRPGKPFQGAPAPLSTIVRLKGGTHGRTP